MFEISTPSIHIMYWLPTVCLELRSFYVFLHNPLNWPVKVGCIPCGDLCGGHAVWLSTRLPWADSWVSFNTGVFVAPEWEFQPCPIFCLPPGRSSGQRPRLTWHPGSSRVPGMRWGSGRCCALSPFELLTAQRPQLCSRLALQIDWNVGCFLLRWQCWMLDKFLVTFCTIASSFFLPQSSRPEWPPVGSVPVQLASH